MKMSKKWLDRVRAAFTTSNATDFEAALTTDAEEPETEEEKKKRLAEEKEKTKDATLVKLLDTLKTLDGRLAKLETHDDDDETEEEKKKRLAKEKADKENTEDSAGLAETVRDTFARAEILSPGLHVPTFDTAAKKTATIDSLCLLKRKALATAFDSGKYKDAITPFLGAAPDFKTLTCDAVSGAFIGASEIVRRENNANTRVTFDGSKAAAAHANSMSEINKKNAAFWARS